MTVFMATGANVWMRVLATDAFIDALDWMSPAYRCEKNRMGRCRTFHMYVVEPTTPTLPLIRSE